MLYTFPEVRPEFIAIHILVLWFLAGSLWAVQGHLTLLEGDPRTIWLVVPPFGLVLQLAAYGAKDRRSKGELPQIKSAPPP